MIAPLPSFSESQIFYAHGFAICITEVVREGWSEGYFWVVTDASGIIEFASGDVDYPGEIGFAKAMKTANAVLKSVAEAEAQGAH